MKISKTKYRQMTRLQKMHYYATSKRITTGIIQQFIDGELVKFHVGKLRGNIVGSADNYKFNTKEEAYKCAFNFRESCQKELHTQLPQEGE